MEYVQERVATLHDFGDAEPSLPTGDLAVVVPMTARDHATLAAERVLSALETVAPARLYVALRAGPERAAEVAAWIEAFDVPATVLWCSAPAVETRLAAAGLPSNPPEGGRPDRASEPPAANASDSGLATPGKGRDVWLALGLAARHDRVVVHDADATTYDAGQVARLAFPLDHGYDLSKGYYARVEESRLYGRLCRLFVRPLLAAVAAEHHDPLLDYLRAFRYPLAGEFAATGEVVEHLRPPPGWGLEIATLGDAFRVAGAEHTAQVDLGRHAHDHRSVAGPDGLGDMASEVGDALQRVLEEGGVTVDHERLPGRYREAAERAIDGFAADAAFNGLTYDPASEREQVETYAAAIAPPGPDRRLPAWRDCELDPEAVRSASRDALSGLR